jgi:hypothetical protein
VKKTLDGSGRRMFSLFSISGLPVAVICEPLWTAAVPAHFFHMAVRR